MAPNPKSIAKAAANAQRVAADPPVIRAYHGSPHDFDRFDASKIGTGEGRQAYGHGLYFAGNEDVSKHYRDEFERLGATDKGHLYEVEIARPQQEFLNWNTPLYQQPDHVQSAFRDLLGSDALQKRGGQAYRSVAEHYGDGLSEDAASRLLLERGIPGVAYREPIRPMHLKERPPKSTSYVMFPGTEDSIRILRKYGLVPPAAAAGASQQEPEKQPILQGLSK